MKWLLAILLAGAVVLIVWRLRSRSAGAGPAALLEDAAAGIDPQIPARRGPPSAAGGGDPLEMIRAALPAMSSEEIEHLLDMGATLKPGADELFRSELRRRREAETD